MTLNQITKNIKSKAKEQGLSEFYNKINVCLNSSENQNMMANNLNFVINDFLNNNKDLKHIFYSDFSDFYIWCKNNKIRLNNKNKISFNNVNVKIYIFFFVLGFIIFCIGTIRMILGINNDGYNYLMQYIFNNGTRELLIGLVLIIIAVWKMKRYFQIKMINKT